MGVEVFRVPAAWSFHTELDDASAVCYGHRMRWDLSLPSPSAQGIVLGLFHGVSTGDGSSQSTSFRGADAGLWWDPFPEKAVALRLAGTLGYWSADASADFRHHADSVVIQADWWGVRTSVGARILLSLGYVGGRVDLDLVHPGELQRNELAPNPDRSNRLAVGGGLEAGLLYRY
jgi:hypothetical protein